MSAMSALLMPNSIIYLRCSLQSQFLLQNLQLQTFLLNITWYYLTPINSNVMRDFFISNDIELKTSTLDGASIVEVKYVLYHLIRH